MKTNTSQSYLLWGIVGALVIISIGIFFYFNSKEPIIEKNTKAQQHIEQPPLAQPLASEPPPSPQNEKLVSDSLVNQPISTNQTLAHEELDKLKDIEAQLLEQEQNLNAQHQDADQLIKLKEQQIELLSKQLNQHTP